MAQNDTDLAAQYTFKWNKEQTEAFVRLRVQYNHLFTGGRDSASNGYRMILDKLGIGGKVTHAQAKKKWDNLKTKYKECKCPASGQDTEDVRPTAATWPWFALMDEALGQTAAVSPLCLIASIQEDKPGPSTAQAAVQELREEEEEQRDRGKQTGRKRRREVRENEFLTLLKNYIEYQREADERREAAAKERADRFFSLLERLAEK